MITGRLKVIFFILVIIIIIFNSKIYSADDGTIAPWDYKGNNAPERWGQLHPSFIICAAGKNQSPINIPEKVIKGKNTLDIDYHPAPLTILLDGATHLEMGGKKLVINDGHTIQVNFSSDDRELITFNDKRYHLKQIHIHTPSENELQGQNFPMELHFVHQSDNGKVVMLGVFAKGGTENPELAKIINNLPQEKNKEFSPENVQILPEQMLPAKQNFYSFMGSLTVPPCSEGVQWVIMANPITISPAQIVKLKTAIGGVNARHVQPLNGRPIQFTVTD